MLGIGLTDARFQLEKLKEKDHRFLVIINNQKLSTILNETFIIFESIIDRWKIDSDFKIVPCFLKNKDYKKVADILKKNRSLMWKREKSLNLNIYYATKNIFNTSLNLYL